MNIRGGKTARCVGMVEQSVKVSESKSSATQSLHY